MVATRGTKDVVSFVIGKESIDPRTIGVEEWVAILRAAAQELPINYLRGLKSIKQILQDEGNCSIARVINGPLPQILDNLRPNAVFLECAETGGGFPPGVHAYETWPKAPRRGTEPPLGELLSLGTDHFLLSRDRKFYCVSVLWTPQEKWDDSLSSKPIKFWYQADLKTFQMMELNDQLLANLLAASHERDLPLRMLQCFRLALRKTESDLRGQLDHIQEQKVIIGSYLARLGGPMLI